MRDGDTIVALSSGAVPSGVAVVRLSGPGCVSLLREMLGRLPEPRRLGLADIVFDGTKFDTGLLAWMPGPASFTGEDCLELQVHGSPAVVKALLRILGSRDGFRLAEAGEFTRRAFENGKLDLTEVEGLGDLILAETEGQRRQAVARLGGGLTRQLDRWRDDLLNARAELEARLDFSDEGDVSEDLPASLVGSLVRLKEELEAAIRSVGGGRIVREGFRVALAGPPNVGKSSLLNALARSELAIVTNEPGTTRDVREVQIDLAGQLVILVDMAGLRETESVAEAEGVRRAREQIEFADLVLWLEAPDVVTGERPQRTEQLWVVHTKSDIGQSGPGLAVSAATGEGIEHLLDAVGEHAALHTGEAESTLVSRERDRMALLTAAESVSLALARLNDEELAAEALRSAAAALERLLGRMDPESVLDRLFSAFCIGK